MTRRGESISFDGMLPMAASYDVDAPRHGADVSANARACGHEQAFGPLPSFGGLGVTIALMAVIVCLLWYYDILRVETVLAFDAPRARSLYFSSYSICVAMNAGTHSTHARRIQQ